MTKFERTVISEPDKSGMTLAETVRSEQFSGGLNGPGEAVDVRLEHSDGTVTMHYIERFTGELDGKRGSFILEGAGFSDHGGFVHGNWEVVSGSGTDQLTGLRGYGAFMAKRDPKSKAGWSARDAFTYWFDQ